MSRKAFSTVSASFVPWRVRVHSELPCNFSTAFISRVIALRRIQKRQTGMDRTKAQRTGKIFQPGNPVRVNHHFPDTYLQSREWILASPRVVQDPSNSLKLSDRQNETLITYLHVEHIDPRTSTTLLIVSNTPAAVFSGRNMSEQS
jgi:hypothetical protein